jgi:hypothetical protein
MVYIKVVVITAIYNFVVDIVIWSHLECEIFILCF